MFYYITQKILFAGCKPGMTPGLQLRLFLMNTTILGSIAFVAPFLLGFALAGFDLIALTCLSYVMCCSLPIYLNVKGRTKSSRILTVIMAISWILIGVSILPSALRFENFFFGLALFPFLLFENRESGERLFYSSLAVAAYLYSFSLTSQSPVYQPTFYMTQAGAVWGFIVVQFAALGAVLVPAYVLIYQSQKNESSFRTEQFLRIKADKMAALGEMSASIAHEINNPLAVMKGRIEQLRILAESETLSAKNLPEILDALRAQVERTTKIVKGLRSYSRSSDDDDMEKHSLDAIIREAIEVCRLKANKYDVELLAEDLPVDVAVMCRPVQIMQVIVNLVNNGIDANREAERAWVKVALSHTNSTAEIRVTDSGRGIDRDLQKSIMEPFFTTKAVGEGTGIGLSLSRNLAEAHSGTLRIDNKSANTCFALSIPLASGEQQAPVKERKEKLVA